MTASVRFIDIACGYRSTPVLEGISLELESGVLAALIGPNGAGKTTLLHLASGTVRPTRGRVELDACDLATMPPRLRAQRIALLPQSLPIPFAFTVREFVALGRTPYLHPLWGEREPDHAAIDNALEITNTASFAHRSVLELSGGERQRVILALALAQEPELLLLDEPTANLDVAQQVAILELIRALNQRQGLTVLAAIHDLNLAALYFERLLVLDHGQLVAGGPPAKILTPALIHHVFGSPVQVVDHPSDPVPLVILGRPRANQGDRLDDHGQKARG